MCFATEYHNTALLEQVYNASLIPWPIPQCRNGLGISLRVFINNLKVIGCSLPITPAISMHPRYDLAMDLLFSVLLFRCPVAIYLSLKELECRQYPRMHAMQCSMT